MVRLYAQTDLDALYDGRTLRTPTRAQGGVMSSVTSHMSTETRVPGVSEASIASNTRAAAAMSSAVSKCCRTTAVARAGAQSQRVVGASPTTPNNSPNHAGLNNAQLHR